MISVSAMDILKPQIVRIGNRCYRKNPVHEKSIEEYEAEEMANDSVYADDEYYDEMCDAFANNIEKTDNGYKIAMDIPSVFFKFLIGKRGDTKKRMENETRTVIRIPSRGMEGQVVVTGHDRKGVISAKTRIDLLVASAREKQPFTHFLSIPINSQSIKDKFADFREDVLRFCDGDRGIDDTIFKNSHKLHLTLGTMPLLNEAEVNNAKILLQDCHKEIIEPIVRGRSLLCQIRGLEYMNDDPSEVDVLYAKVQLHDGSDRLQHIADQLVERFVSAGLVQRDHDHVKLHITVMNSLMRKDNQSDLPSGSSHGNRPPIRERESFDASRVLQLYGDFDFGTYNIDTIHLSQLHSVSAGGYYNCAASITL